MTRPSKDRYRGCGGMAEKRIGLIPNAATMVRAREEDCKILVTDRRLIMIFDEPRNAFKLGLKSLLGKEADEPPIPREELDFATIDIDKLAKMNDSAVIPYFSIDRFKMDTTLGVFSFTVEYKNEENKKLEVYATLAPPQALSKMRKAEGLSRREIRRQYGLKCQELFKRALPSSIAQNVEWKQ